MGQQGLLILLVDDFEDAVDIYSTYLTHRGFRVRTAANGIDAIRQAELETPALILLDLQMPLLDGAGALRQLRADTRFASVPIVALTAHALDDERRAALVAGFDGVISKPCLPDELVALIGRFLGTP